MRKTALPVHQARSRESLARLLKATTVEVLDEDGIERSDASFRVSLPVPASLLARFTVALSG